MENYLDRSQPIFPTEQLELQAHGTRVAYRDIYVRRLTGGAEKFTLSEEEKSAGFEVLFDGTHLDKWTGNKDGRSEEHTSELQSLMRISYAVFCLKKKIKRRRMKKQR